MNTYPNQLHRFTPSRPDGVVCVAYRRADPLDSMREVCGYPAGHPIHAGLAPDGVSQDADVAELRELIDNSSAMAWRRERMLGVLDRIAARLRAMPEPELRCAFKDAHSCRICGRWLDGEWLDAGSEQTRIELQRQMDAGHCDECHERVCLGVCGKPIEGDPEPCALRTGHQSPKCLSVGTIDWQHTLGGPLPAEDLRP